MALGVLNIFSIEATLDGIAMFELVNVSIKILMMSDVDIIIGSFGFALRAQPS